MLSRTRIRVQRSLKTCARALSSQSSLSAEKSGIPPAHPTTPTAQSPNYPKTWSTSQRSRDDAYKEGRFEQTALNLQPQPLSAMEMIAEEPIRMVKGRKAVCDGGIGPLGHPKVFINLDKPGPKACGYCGIRFEQVHEHH